MRSRWQTFWRSAGIAALLCLLSGLLAVFYAVVEQYLRVEPLIGQLWVQVTCLLTLFGAIGGFAFHLVKNEGKAIFPGWQDSMTFRLGLLADVFVGVAAANAIHIAISGVVTYNNTAKDDPRFYLNFVALGILCGFAGATLLQALSKKLQESLAEKVGNIEKNLNATSDKTDLLFESRALRMLEDALLFRRASTKNDEEILQQSATDLQRKAESERTPKDWLVLAYYYSERNEVVRTLAALDRIAPDALPSDWEWILLNLKGLTIQCQQKDGWFAQAEVLYCEAIQRAEKSSPSDVKGTQRLVTTINRAYARKESKQWKAAIEFFDNALKDSAMASSPLVLRHVAHLGKAMSLARQALEAGDIETARTDVRQILANGNTDLDLTAYLFEDGTVEREDFDALVLLMRDNAKVLEKLKSLEVRLKQ